ncbi:RHS domain-containing protein, partial [Burkholderia gladioli]|nr:RHS domain-containing protein [Burkholderia gladioli]
AEAEVAVVESKNVAIREGDGRVRMRDHARRNMGRYAARAPVEGIETPVAREGDRYRPEDDPLQRVPVARGDARVMFYYCDQIGTPLMMTDEAGEVVWEAAYKAWGETREVIERASAASGGAVARNTLRFQGQQVDDETGLHYNRHRYYDPVSGRFTSRDPIKLAGGINVYQYAPNSVSWVDQLGLAGTPIQENEVTTYSDFVKRSAVGDRLEGHEVLQHAWLKNQGLASNRLSTDASKNNPVIALNCDCHKAVNKAQRALDVTKQTAQQNIEANADILRANGIPDATVDNIRQAALNHAKTLGK